jgi:hypothetical protein
MLQRLLLTFFLLIYSACAIANKPENVSLVQLIANPDQYDGKLVRVFGYLNLEFEGDALYLHEEDFRRGLTRNGIWVSLVAAKVKQTTRPNRRYVLVEGVFNAKDNGHMGLFAGSIGAIQRLDDWTQYRR